MCPRASVTCLLASSVQLLRSRHVMLALPLPAASPPAVTWPPPIHPLTVRCLTSTTLPELPKLLSVSHSCSYWTSHWHCCHPFPLCCLSDSVSSGFLHTFQAAGLYFPRGSPSSSAGWCSSMSHLWLSLLTLPPFVQWPLSPLWSQLLFKNG